MINITYLPLKNVNKLRLLYGEGHIKALAGKVFWIRENEKRYITEVVIDIKSHSPLKESGEPTAVIRNHGNPATTPELARGGGKPTIHKSSGTLIKYKECENCGYKAEKEPEVDFLICPMCNSDLEEFEE